MFVGLTTAPYVSSLSEEIPWSSVVLPDSLATELSGKKDSFRDRVITVRLLDAKGRDTLDTNRLKPVTP